MPNFRYSKDMSRCEYYHFGLNIPRNMNCTVNWLCDGHIKATKDTFYFKTLVKDCIAQLKRGFNSYCFSREQAEEIAQKFVKRGYHVVWEENLQEGYIELRRESD